MDLLSFHGCCSLGCMLYTGVLQKVLARCITGVSVREICCYGDQLILEETTKIFKKEKNLRKGIAFPTCVSLNNCICHFSPTDSEADSMLKEGDLAKIDLGAHVDGFIAVVAHSIVVGTSEDTKVHGKKAAVILAAHYASEVALRLLRPGIETYTITEAVDRVCRSFGCKPVEGMLSHQLKQFRIDGEKTIIQNPNEAQRKEHEKFTLGMHEFTLGRSPLSNLVLLKQSVSRTHAEIRKDDENWMYPTIASNDDSINDVVLKRNDEIILKSNDIITICGDAHYKYSFILDTIKTSNQNVNVDGLLKKARAEMEITQNTLVSLVNDPQVQRQQVNKVRADMETKCTDREVLKRLLQACEDETAQLRVQDTELGDSCVMIEKNIIYTDAELNSKCRDLRDKIRFAIEENHKALEAEASSEKRNEALAPRKQHDSDNIKIDAKKIKRE